jgi:hypothetical protein
MKKEAEYPNLNRKMKKIFRLLNHGHILTCNEGTTEFRFYDNCFEVRFLDGTSKWISIKPENVQEEIIDVLRGQNYSVDRKRRIHVYFRFCWWAFWVGGYWDYERKILYLCPFPMVVVCFSFKQ